MTNATSGARALCQLYKPGHNVHWIQANHASRSERFRVTGLTIANDRIAFTADGAEYSRWTHNLAYLVALLEKCGETRIDFCRTFSILYIETEGPRDGHGRSSRMFYLTDAPTDCVGGEPGYPLGEVRVNED